MDDLSIRILRCVLRGTASTRSGLARHLALAPSTVSTQVKMLIDDGLLEEAGIADSSGGRPPRVLRLPPERGGQVLVGELGSTHTRLGVMTHEGQLRAATTEPIRIADGPDNTLTAIAQRWQELLDPALPVLATGLALPGPVSLSSGGVDLPARMPGWSGFGVRDWLRRRYEAPAVVDNDANLMALGEHFACQGDDGHSITVKTGTAIGSGIIINGDIYRGATCAAGDIAHTSVEAAAETACSCGNTGCLDTIASGAGLVRLLRGQGYDVTTTAEVLALSADDPTAATLTRRAGACLGQVLAGVVNFFNPHAVYLTGGLSASEPFVAAVRSMIYESCHPLVTRQLRIQPAITGQDAALHGAAKLAVDAWTAHPMPG